ncbi:hypothetical protein [Legionella tunisiensis]|uniref:hypothetical protein n=1 Tax=Legionella tunisiensis TaxID=1034944 RepID=UPI00031B8D34|nr:hypothetical protein [Legionella tunisiensis]
MFHPKSEDKIAKVLKDSDANFRVSSDTNGNFLKSKLFSSHADAASVLADISSKIQLSYIAIEVEPGSQGWYIVYNANPAVLSQFPHEAIKNENFPEP